MWDGLNSSITHDSFRNYMYGNNVYILDTIESANCAYLIGDLTSFIQNPNNQIHKNINFYINSNGGDVYTTLALIGIMNLARIHGYIINTWVFGWAASAASLLASQGDQRMISMYSKHFLHFGTIVDYTYKYSEIEKTYKQNLEYVDIIHNLYITASRGKLTSKLLHNLESDERGYVLADSCIEYGLADLIIEEDLSAKEKYAEALEKFNATYNKKHDK